MKVILMEAAPRDMDMEWDRVNELWKSWFESMNIDSYMAVKRMALSKEKDILQELLESQ